MGLFDKFKKTIKDKNPNVRQQDINELGDDLMDNECPHDFAKRFKEAIEKNDGGAAADLLIL